MTEKRSALIIANYEFEDNNLRQLVAPPQDAESLARVLADETIGAFEVQIVLNKPSHELNQIIESFFLNRKRDDLLLVYFSGHGLKDEDGQLYFATTNTQHKLLRSTAVSAQFVNGAMQRSKSRRQVLFLDCCHSGAFGRVKGEKNIDTAEQFKGQGRVIITASDAMQYAFEGDEIHGKGIHSIFTRTLVRGLETGEADLDKDGQISLDELYNYVYEKVTDEKPEQTPQRWTFDLKGEIFIAQNKFYLLEDIQLQNQVCTDGVSSLIKLGYKLQIKDDFIDKVNWSPDGKLIAGLYYKSQSINIWDSKTGELIQSIKTKWNKVTDFTWSHDGETIAIIADIDIRVSEKLTYFKNIVYLEEKIKLDTKIIVTKKDSKKSLEKSNEEQNIIFWNLKVGEIKLLSEIKHGRITCLEWSPSGKILAAGYNNGKICLWNLEENNYVFIENDQFPISKLVWSPKDKIIISVLNNNKVKVWDSEFSSEINFFLGDKDILNLAFSPDGNLLAFAFKDKTVGILDTNTWQLLRVLEGHTNEINSLSFSHDGQFLSSHSIDNIIYIWRSIDWNIVLVMSDSIDNTFLNYYNTLLSMLRDRRAVANTNFSRNISNYLSLDIKRSNSKNNNEESDTVTNQIVSGDEPIDLSHINFVSKHHITNGKTTSESSIFNPKTSDLAIINFDKKNFISVWNLDFNILYSIGKGKAVKVEYDSSVLPQFEVKLIVLKTDYYTNAKIVLLGDTGVGKSGLGLVITGQSFKATESTHGRYIWTFDNQDVELSDGRLETHEALLWDLAGQPGYRLIHQLHLNDVAVALVIFDARSEVDPFAGVRHWERALRQAQRLQGSIAPQHKKFLVAARADRGGAGVSQARIESIVREFGFDGYFETSAKEGWKIAELVQTLRKAINWETIPKVSSTELFHKIKDFIVKEKEAERLLSTEEDLYRSFLTTEHSFEACDELIKEFKTCIELVESRGLIRRLSFGNLILLQPEFLDAYASAIVNAAKDEPDGLGSIAEEDAREGRFRISGDERLKDKEQERLLLIATVEDLLRYEIALRELADDGIYLIFPSQFTREYPDAPDPEGKTVFFKFEGAVLNIYATLAVRLSHSGLFIKKEMWRNAAIYSAKAGGSCGMFLRELEEGKGELTLFFSPEASEETRFYFEEYVSVHLQRRAISETIIRQSIFICDNCGFVVTHQLLKLRNERNFNWVQCPGCEEQQISLLDHKERLKIARDSAVPQMDRAADARRNQETITSILQGKITTGDFDVLFCYNNNDSSTVTDIEIQVKEHGILPYMFSWEKQTDESSQNIIEDLILKRNSTMLFISNSKQRPWQNIKFSGLLRRMVAQGIPVITVILPDVIRKPTFPEYLKSLVIDFRKPDPDPMSQIIFGCSVVTGIAKDK